LQKHFKCLSHVTASLTSWLQQFSNFTFMWSDLWSNLQMEQNSAADLVTWIRKWEHCSVPSTITACTSMAADWIQIFIAHLSCWVSDTVLNSSIPRCIRTYLHQMKPCLLSVGGRTAVTTWCNVSAMDMRLWLWPTYFQETAVSRNCVLWTLTRTIWNVLELSQTNRNYVH